MHRWTNIYMLSFRYLLPFFLIIYLLKDIYIKEKELLRALLIQLQFHTLLQEMAGSPQLMCIHNVKHDWFSDSAVPHNTRHIALYDIVFRTS